MQRVDPESIGFSRDRLDRVSEWLNEQVSSGRLAGCSVMIGRRGGVGLLEATGLADMEAHKPFLEDTIVRIFSMTKAITTVAAPKASSWV